MAYVTDTRAHGFAVVEFAKSAVKTLAASFAQYKVYSSTVNELSNLSDRDLNDLGVHRSAIKGIAIEAAYKA